MTRISGWALAHRISALFRRRRFERFRTMLGVTPGDRILDVGGLPKAWLGSGLEARVTLLNLRLPDERPPPFTWVEGDACDLGRYDDGSFDVVFSNSVIEHVGDWERQRKMAAGVRRVAVRYWVQTPYRHFPLEPHFLFPFFQYLPPRGQRFVARAWPFSFPRLAALDPVRAARTTRLLDRAEWRELWPDAELTEERFAGLTKSLMAYRRARA